MAEEQVIKLNIEGNPVFKLEGQNGKSAYEIWLESGNSGTREDFLKSLKGPVGPKGDKGEQGIQGPQGLQGPQGIQGDTGIAYTPSLDTSGVLSWTANGSTPTTVNIATILTNIGFIKQTDLQPILDELRG